jgi:hypothetical protein
MDKIIEALEIRITNLELRANDINRYLKNMVSKGVLDSRLNLFDSELSNIKAMLNAMKSDVEAIKLKIGM